MASRDFVVPALLSLSLLVPATPLRADPIQITGGSVILVGQFTAANRVDIQGTQGFSAEFIPGNVSGQWVCRPCGAPGDLFSLDAAVSTVDGAGTVEFAGVTYTVGATVLSPGTGFAFLGPHGGSVILPPLSPKASLSVPFELRASVLFLDNGGPTELEMPLMGRGTATLDLVASQFDPLWELSSVRYDFAPVPEPATLLLVGAGMFAVPARRHRRRRSGSERAAD